MREILFRGKRVDNGEWVEGYYYLHQDGISYIIIHSTGYPSNRYVEVLSETVGQYTGLTDKNGTSIFEGDIVDIIPEDEPSVIKWDDDSARFVIINSCERDFDNYWGHELEIIGNIHDNPEFLEGDKNMNIDVKPCPFCGDAWVYASTGDYGSGYEHYGYRVNCRCNFAWSAIGWNERKADVIAAWNRMADNDN